MWENGFFLKNTHPNEEVDHEENVEREIDLLSRVLVPRNAILHAITIKNITSNKIKYDFIALNLTEPSMYILCISDCKRINVKNVLSLNNVNGVPEWR